VIEYYNDNTAISLELLILSGGTTVTGKTPVALIRDKDSGNYFDFASRTFTSTTTSATAVLTSALDGIYKYTWDTSGLFTSNSGHHLTVEYHDSTGASIEDILVTSKERMTLYGGGGGGPTTIKGVWSAEQKKRLLKDVAEIKKDIKAFKERVLFLFTRILAKKTLRPEDIQFIQELRERGKQMWQEFLKVMKLREGATAKELLVELEEYYKAEESASKEVKERLTKLREKVKPGYDWDKPEED